MSTTLVFETGVLTTARFALFFGCRKYLLRSLYSDLQALSDPAITNHSHPSSPNHVGGDVELETLPTPSTHTPKSPSFLSKDAPLLNSTIPRTIFSWCFAESCLMFILLVSQGLGIFSTRSRLLNWKFSLFFLVSTTLLIIPLCVSLLLSLGSGARSLRRLRAASSLLPVAVYLFGISQIPIPSKLDPLDFPTAVLSRLIVLGTIILGLLSGFGAISSSWRYLPFISQRRDTPSERDIDAAQYALTSIRNDIQTRQTEVSRRDSSEGSWFSRVGTSFRGGDSLTQELRGLEALEYQMSRNLEDLRERLKAAQFDRTLQGKFLNLMGRVFMLYCVTRVVSSLYNVIFLSSRQSTGATYPDLITELFVFCFSKIYSEAQVSHEDVVSLARQVSLLLVGIIILSSIRMILRGVTRMLRVTSRSLAVALMILVLAQIISIYLLSTIVQMRSSFPPPMPNEGNDTEGSNLFTTIPEYEMFGSLFDWSFLIAAIVSLFLRWGAERVNGVGND